MSFLLQEAGRLTIKSDQNTFSGKFYEILYLFRLKGKSGCPSCTHAPRRSSCEVRPGTLLGTLPRCALEPFKDWSLLHLGNLSLPAPFPACPHGESFQPDPLLLQFMPGVPCPATHSSEERICLSTSPPSRHWGGCDVPLKWSLLQAGQVPLSQALGQCSQDTLKP